MTKPKDYTRWLPSWLEAGIIVVFWALVALLTIARTTLDPRSAHQGSLHEGEVLQVFLEYGVWALLTPFLIWIGGRLAYARDRWLRAGLLYVAAGVAVAVAVDLVDHILWNALVVGGPPRPVSVPYVLSGFHFLGEFSLYAILLVAGFARSSLIRLKENEKEAARLQARLAEARLQTLRMQINPHFLFNTLHVISDNFEENPAAARRMIARLSEILRYTFRETSPREVVLSQELQFLDGYLDIQRFRFEDRLVVTKDISKEVGEALVPNLILQPIVENAVKHGVSQVEGVGRIHMRGWRDGDMLHLTVRDNGPGLQTRRSNGSSVPSEGVGLSNTRARLEGAYGEQHAFTLTSPPEGGVLVHIAIPFHLGSDYKLDSVEEDEVSP